MDSTDSARNAAGAGLPARSPDEAVARMAAVLETMDAAVVGVSPSGDIRSWNRGAEKVFGYAPHEVIGKPLSILVPPEYAEELEQLHERMAAGESLTDYETVRLRKDGTPVYVAVTQSPYRDAQGDVGGYSVIAQDMTERIRVEEAVVRGGERYKELIDGLPLAAFRASTDGVMLDANPAFRRLVSAADRSSVVNRRVADFFDEPRELSKVVASLRDGRPVSGAQLSMRRPDGRRLHVLCTGQRILDDDGQLRGFLLLLEDITERAVREADTRQLSVLQELVIRILGHDLKAPIAVVQGHLELAQAELAKGGAATPEALQKRLRRASEATASMLVTLANARAISRLTMGPEESSAPELIDIARIVREMATILRPLAEARHQQLKVEAPQELLAKLPPGFESVVGNLLTNAIRYTPSSGHIDVVLRQADGHAVLEVSDTGPGVPADLRPRLFRKFERLHEEQSVGSHGLGLSIAYSIVELAGGTIEIGDRDDGAQGARFLVEVPAGGEGPRE